MGAQNFNFAPKFFQSRCFSVLNFALLDKNFPIKNFLTAQNLEGLGQLPPYVPGYNATVNQGTK